MRPTTLLRYIAPLGLILAGITSASPAASPNSLARSARANLHRVERDVDPASIWPRQAQDESNSTPTSVPITNENAQDAPRTSCGFDGDSDTYGLGIRIGVYTQWASGVIANWYVTEMAHTMRVRATLFQMAMAIALAFITIRKPRPYAVDALIMVVILLGSTSSLTSHVIRPRQWKHTTLGGRMRFLFFFLLSLYASWFWWTGMERFKALPPQPEGCSGLQYGFFFHRTDLFADWYRKTNFALAVTAASITGVVLVGFIQHYYKVIWAEFYSAFKDQTSGEFGGLLAGMDGGEAGAGAEPAPQEPQGPSAKALGASKDKFLEKNPEWWKPAIAGAVMLLAIIAVELLISWNNIQGVNTILNTGQLIPFVIGIGGLGKILFRWWQLETVKKKVTAGGSMSKVTAGAVGEKKF